MKLPTHWPRPPPVATTNTGAALLYALAVMGGAAVTTCSLLALVGCTAAHVDAGKSVASSAPLLSASAKPVELFVST
jgi:hypothetical protein